MEAGSRAIALKERSSARSCRTSTSSSESTLGSCGGHKGARNRPGHACGRRRDEPCERVEA
eukprot:6214791-Pleurochrysis_carterae.AAC.10